MVGLEFEIASERISFRVNPTLRSTLIEIAKTRKNKSVSNLITEILESDARVYVLTNKLL